MHLHGSYPTSTSRALGRVAAPPADFSQFAVGVRCYAFAAALLVSNGIACDTPTGHDAIGTAALPPSNQAETPVDDLALPDSDAAPAARTLDKEQSYQLLDKVFSESLERVGEPPMLAPARSTEYRLIQLPPWGPPRIIRVDPREVIVKKFEGRWLSRRLRPSIVARRSIFRAERSALSHALEEMDFWNTPVLNDAGQYHDGVLWVLEVRSSRRHHAVLRSSTSLSPRSLPAPFAAACELILRLGG